MAQSYAAQRVLRRQPEVVGKRLDGERFPTERELHEWLDGVGLEIVELSHDGRIVRIVQRETVH